MRLAESRTRVTILLYDLNTFPSWKKAHSVGRAETCRGWVRCWELAIGGRGQLEVKTKKQTCPWLIGSRFSQRYIARFASSTSDFETRPGRHKSSVVTMHIYIYIRTTVHCRQYRNTLYWLREEKEAGEEGRSEVRRGESREGRRLVTGVRSGWSRASRSMMTKYPTSSSP